MINKLAIQNEDITLISFHLFVRVLETLLYKSLARNESRQSGRESSPRSDCERSPHGMNAPIRDSLGNWNPLLDTFWVQTIVKSTIIY